MAMITHGASTTYGRVWRWVDLRMVSTVDGAACLATLSLRDGVLLAEATGGRAAARSCRPAIEHMTYRRRRPIVDGAGE